MQKSGLQSIDGILDTGNGSKRSKTSKIGNTNGKEKEQKDDLIKKIKKTFGDLSAKELGKAEDEEIHPRQPIAPDQGVPQDHERLGDLSEEGSQLMRQSFEEAGDSSTEPGEEPSDGNEKASALR